MKQHQYFKDFVRATEVTTNTFNILEVMAKPVALYIRPIIPAGKEGIYLNLFTKREKALSTFFELVTPDYNPSRYDLVIYNVHDYLHIPETEFSIPEDIPKLCLLSNDAVSQSLFNIISYFEQLGVDAYFAVDTSMHEYAPSISHKLFLWPWGVLKEDFQGLPAKKKGDIILTTGNFLKAYQWRQKVFPVLRKAFKTVDFEHFQKNRTPKFGKDFNRVLSQARIVPTCGGYNQILVLKHLEIPASGSLLLTEETQILLDAGFVDRQNCLFANEHNAVEICRQVLKDNEQYNRIVNAGKELVFNQHDYMLRNPVYEWFQLYKIGGKENIYQENPFKPLMRGSHLQTKPWIYQDTLAPIVQLNIDQLQKARKEDEKIILNYINEYFLNYPGYLYRAAIFYLCKGKPAFAYLYLLKVYLAHQKFRDPVLLALLAICCAALGKLRLAQAIHGLVVASPAQSFNRIVSTLLYGKEVQQQKDVEMFVFNYHGLFNGNIPALCQFLSRKYASVHKYYKNVNSNQKTVPIENDLSELYNNKKMAFKVQLLKLKIAVDKQLFKARHYDIQKFY